MTMRRSATGALGLLLFMASWTVAATAPSWPDPGRSIQALVPAQAGSGVGNTIARVVTEALSTELGNRIVLQNFTSSHGMLSNLEAGGEGYTVLFATVDSLVSEPALERSPALEPLPPSGPSGLAPEVPPTILLNNNLPLHALAEPTPSLP